METSSRPGRTDDGTPTTERQLPPHRSKLQRIANHTTTLFEDLTEWAELRVQLLRIEIQERIQEEREKITLIALAGIMGTLAGLFFLVTASLFLGWLLGHPAWGFLIVTVVLALVAMAFYAAYQRKAQADQQNRHE